MVEIKDLTVAIGGRNILNGISFDFADKGVYAVLCASDEQKKLLAELISGCCNADGGEILIDGEPMSRNNTHLKKTVRLAPSADFAFGDVSPYEYIQFIGISMGIEREKLARQIAEAVDLLGLGSFCDKPIRALSGTQKCRVSIAASLVGNPDVIVIDSALDTLAGKSLEEVYDILDMLGGIKTVILITSKPSHAKRLCDHAVLIAGGRVVLCDKIADIEAKINDSAQTKISVRGDAEAVLAAIRSMSGITSVKLIKTSRDKVSEIEIEHEYDAFIKDRLFGTLAAINAPMLSSATAALTLEDVYYTLCVRAEKKNEGREAAK